MVDAEDEEYSEGVDEKDRPRRGNACIAGVGEVDGEGEEFLVKGGELEALLAGIDAGSTANLGGVDPGFKASLGGPCV